MFLVVADDCAQCPDGKRKSTSTHKGYGGHEGHDRRDSGAFRDGDSPP